WPSGRVSCDGAAYQCQPRHTDHGHTDREWRQPGWISRERWHHQRQRGWPGCRRGGLYRHYCPCSPSQRGPLGRWSTQCHDRDSAGQPRHLQQSSQP
ncbi:conserved hypothetical protein, partial [Ricinus communis]